MHKYSFMLHSQLTELYQKTLLTISLCIICGLPERSYTQTLQEKYHTFFAHYYLSNLPLVNAGKIIASEKDQELITSGDTVYASTTKPALFYFVFSHIDPISYDTSKYDYIFKRIGKAKFISSYQGTLVLEIISMIQEIHTGDFLIADDVIDTKLPDQEVFANKRIQGHVNTLEKASNFVGTYQSVLINIGQSDGLKMGMRIYFESPAVKHGDYALPGHYLGQGFVYRLASHHAIVLVTDAKQEVTVGSNALTQLSTYHANQ